MRKNAGFTLVELIIGTVILAIAVAGVYASFIGAAKFASFFRHDVQAVISAESFLEEVRAESKWTNVVTTPPAAPVVTSWPLNSEVNNLSATRTIVDNVGCGSGNTNYTNDYKFKRVDVEVSWDERQI